MRSRTGILLQARMASTRLPGKALELIENRPLLEHCLRRLLAAGVGRVVLATTTLEEDSVLCDLATRLGVAVYRGSDSDVLDRMAGAAEAFDLDPIIRATGDNPPWTSTRPAGRLGRSTGLHADYVCEDGLPYGAAGGAVTRDALMRAAREARDPDDREHVTTWSSGVPTCGTWRSPLRQCRCAGPDCASPSTRPPTWPTCARSLRAPAAINPRFARSSTAAEQKREVA
jgi:spore coat polysaccharide biosynthesis protein SpsF